MVGSARNQLGYFALLLLVGICSIILFSAGALYVKSQASPKKGEFKAEIHKRPEVLEKEGALEFKKYTKEELGFEITIPQGFKVLEDSEDEFNKRTLGGAEKSGAGDYRKNFTNYVQYEPGVVLGAVSLAGENGGFEDSPFTVWVFENPGGLEEEGWYKKYWYYPFVWGDFIEGTKRKVAPTNEATISGELGWFGIVDYRPNKPKFYYVSKEGRMYLFRVLGEEKILENFKFL